MIRLNEYEAVLASHGIDAALVKKYVKVFGHADGAAIVRAIAQHTRLSQRGISTHLHSVDDDLALSMNALKLVGGGLVERAEQRYHFSFCFAPTTTWYQVSIKLNAYGRKLKFSEIVCLALAEVITRDNAGSLAVQEHTNQKDKFALAA